MKPDKSQIIAILVLIVMIALYMIFSTIHNSRIEEENKILQNRIENTEKFIDLSVKQGKILKKYKETLDTCDTNKEKLIYANRQLSKVLFECMDKK